jgi:DNA-binding response OmpR family regulator
VTRPAKTILLISPNHITSSVIAYQSVVWGYDVTQLHSYGAAEKALKASHFDLVLFVATVAPWRDLIKAAERVDAIQRSRYQRTRLLTHRANCRRAWRRA